MSTEMAQSKKGSRGTAKAPEPRPKSKLTLEGDRAAHKAKRALLLKTLKAHGWNLTHTAEALDMPGPSQVVRAMKELDLEEEYEDAKQRGDIARGRPSEN